MYKHSCADVGSDSDYVIFGDNKEKVMENAIIHMFENHVTDPEETTVYEIEDL